MNDRNFEHGLRGGASRQTWLAELLHRTAAQDVTAFTALYTATKPALYAVILRVLRDPGYAEETVQEVYLQVWQRAHTYRRSAGPVTSWIHTIGRRRAIDRVRHEQTAARCTQMHATLDQPRDAPDYVVDAVLQADEHRAMTGQLETLTALQRESIELSYYRGLTYSQVAEHLDTALPTIKTRIRDGLRALRSRVEPADRAAPHHRQTHNLQS